MTEKPRNISKSFSVDAEDEDSPNDYSPINRVIEEDFIGADDITRSFSGVRDEEQQGEENNKLNDGDDSLSENSRMADISQNRPPLSRSTSTKSLSSHGFFSSKVANERTTLFRAFVKNWIIMATCLLMIFSIYWGALYNRAAHLKNLKMLLVVEDDDVDGIPSYFGQQVEEIATGPIMKLYTTFTVYNSSSFKNRYDSSNYKNPFNVTKEIDRIIHHQKYWGAFYVKPNTTYRIFQAMKNANKSFDPNLDPNYSFDIVYETGRDILAMNSTLLPLFEVMGKLLTPQIISKNIYTPLILNNLTSSERSNLINNAPGVVANIPTLHYRDNLPVTDSTTLAPSQVGMIFIIIITFFQFNFFGPTHQIIGTRVKKSHFVLYRMISAQISYFVLSLVYAWVSLAFQVDFQKTFGNSGFLVFWMTCYLTMAAVGGATENMALFIIPVYPPLIGFWLIFWVISNISPTFFAIAILPKFYRYGYFFPIHNASEILKVILNNSYKGELGRNYGILVAWVVVNNLLLPFALRFFGQKMAEKAKA